MNRLSAATVDGETSRDEVFGQKVANINDYRGQRSINAHDGIVGGEDGYLGYLSYNANGYYKEGKENAMDNNELMIKHIESIAEDIRRDHTALKDEVREREERITQNQSKLEDRIDSKLDKFIEDSREREVRLNEKLDKLDTKFDGLNTKLDAKVDELNTKIDTKFDHLREEVSKESRNVILSVVALTIAVVLGIAGLIISVLQLVPKG